MLPAGGTCFLQLFTRVLATMSASHQQLLLSALALLASAEATATGYDVNEAKMMALLSSATYCTDDQQLLDWSCQSCKDSQTPMVAGKVKIIDAGVKNATRIVVGKLGKQPGCALIFRGSVNKENWNRDFEFWKLTPSVFEDCKGCRVHSGFLHVWRNVQDKVMTALSSVGCTGGGKDNVLYVTGHSYGAALTHVAMFALKSVGFEIAKTYTFESPRIGNKAFVQAFSQAFSGRVFRITHHMDPYVHLPPEALGYVHVETEVYYDGTGNYRICTGNENRSCADQFWNIPSMLQNNQADHCITPLVPNGNICGPPSCGVRSSSLEILV
jgi:hypothetical protein